MADYHIISDVGEALIRLLREGMVPEIIPNTEGIGMCHPSDRGDVSLGLFLYDIRRNPDIVSTNRVAVGNDKLKSPSLFLDLYFMIGIRCPDETVIGSIHQIPDALHFRRSSVDEFLRGDSGRIGPVLDLLSMFIGSCLETDVIALQPAESRDGVCQYDLVGIADVGFA